MATKHDEFKVYYFSFTDEELVRILWALRCHGEEEFANEIAGQIYGNCDDCDCGDPIGKLTICIDCSDVVEARHEIDKLTCAVDTIAEAYRGLSEAQRGPVEYSLDATERLIKELLAGALR